MRVKQPDVTGTVHVTFWPRARGDKFQAKLARSLNEKYVFRIIFNDFKLSNRLLHISNYQKKKKKISCHIHFKRLWVLNLSSFSFIEVFTTVTRHFNPLTPVPAITSRAKTNPKLPAQSACNLKSLLFNILNENFFYFSDYGFKGFSLLHSHMEWLSNTNPVSCGKSPIMHAYGCQKIMQICTTPSCQMPCPYNTGSHTFPFSTKSKSRPGVATSKLHPFSICFSW